jgi:serine protease Do
MRDTRLGLQTVIRQTLETTKAATFCVNLPSQEREGMPSPKGTGFFISKDGWFVTAAHVIHDANGAVRSDVGGAFLTKEAPAGEAPKWLQWPSVEFVDQATDIALLKLDFDRNSSVELLKSLAGFPCLTVSTRPLQEGEPVYAFGYPLPVVELVERPEITIGLTFIAPRVTSAIVASNIEHHGGFMTSTDPIKYVLDKALNYGNSGGPIIAAETGHVHAVCTRFQPVCVPQPHLLDSAGDPLVVRMPSLYGIVSSLSNPSIRKELGDRGIDYRAD